MVESRETPPKDKIPTERTLRDDLDNASVVASVLSSPARNLATLSLFLSLRIPTGAEFARRLHADLQANHPRVWFAPEDLKSGIASARLSARTLLKTIATNAGTAHNRKASKGRYRSSSRAQRGAQMGAEAKFSEKVPQRPVNGSAGPARIAPSGSPHRVLKLQQSIGNRAVQRLIQRPDLQSRLNVNLDIGRTRTETVPDLAAREPEESSDTPTEEQKQAALAAAARAEQVASQAAAVGKAEIEKSAQSKTKENQLKQAGKQKAQASSAAAEQAKKKGVKKPGPGGAGGRKQMRPSAGAAAAGGRDGARATKSPAEDPVFQKVVKRVGGVAEQQRSHKTPEEKAAEAQAAAVAPAQEITGRAQGNKAAEIEQAPVPPFNAAAFKEQLLKRIADLAPKTLSEADNFKSDNRLGGVKDEMQGQVAAEKTSSKEPLEMKAGEPPNPATVDPKPVKAIPPPAPGGRPPAVGAAEAAPKPKTRQEVEEPIKENTASVGQELQKENITEEQLAKSNEPSFQGALSAKKQAEAHAATAPAAYRKGEQATVAGAKGQAVAVAAAGTQSMHASRADAFGKVHGVQQQSKSKDEAARLKVGQDIDKIYQETSADVGKILTELDGKVESAFDDGAKAAKQVFEDYVDAQMEAYKERRYGGWFGWARWAKDKILGMPDAVNVFYERGRNLYISKMDEVIDHVVAIIGKELTAARARVAEGRKKITEYLAGLPESLKKVGGEAAENALVMFDSLEEQVNSKQESLIDTLANKYQENLKAIDARIEELKAANRGLVAKAIDAVKAVVNAIIELKNFLKTVLAKVAGVVSLILEDPIGFLGNLISALKQGFSNFAENIWDHIKGGFIRWLTGAMGSLRLTMPEDVFSIRGMFSILVQVLGISWDYIRAKAVKLLGAPAVRVLEGTFTVFQILIKEGPAGLWEFAKEKFTDLKNALVDQIQDMVVTQVIKAGIKWLLGLLNPVSAFIKAAMAIYEIVKFFIEKARQIGEFISAVVDGVADVAKGSISGAAKRVEDSLVNALPLIIGFLASLLGVSGLADKVQKLFTGLRSRVDAFIDGLVLKARRLAGKLIKKAGKQGQEQAPPGDKEASLRAAVTEVREQMSAEGATVQTVQTKLPAIQSKHGLTSLTLVRDKQNQFHVKAAINPVLEGPPGVLFTREELVELEAVAKEYANHINEKDKRNPGFKARATADLPTFIKSGGNVQTGKMVEAMAGPALSELAKEAGLSVIQNAALEWIGADGKKIGGKGPELDFLVVGPKGVQEVVSTKFKTGRVSVSNDLEHLNTFMNIPLGGPDLINYVKRTFGVNKAYDRITGVRVVSRNHETMSLGEFREKYLSQIPVTNIEITPVTPHEAGSSRLQLRVTRDELVAKVIELMQPYL